MVEFPDWTRAFVIMGDDPDNGLRVVRLDDEGRLSAFVIDSRDAWEQILTIGNAELAARLGSLQRFDSRGNLQYGTDFSEGLPGWWTGGNGLGAAEALDPTTFVKGGYSVKLTAGSTLNHWARVQGAISYVPTTRMGAEAVFSLAGATGDVELWCSVYSGTHTYEVKVRYDYANSNLEVWDGNPDWVVVDNTFTMYTDTRLFHHIKVVWDMSAETYVRVLVNGTEYPATAYALETAVLEFTPIVSVIFTNTGRLAANDVVNLDSIVVTNQEPE